MFTFEVSSSCCDHRVAGLGDVMLIAPGEVLTASYFRRHRSLALAIAKCGASVGGMTIPVLVTYMLSEYGLRGQ